MIFHSSPWEKGERKWSEPPHAQRVFLHSFKQKPFAGNIIYNQAASQNAASQKTLSGNTCQSYVRSILDHSFITWGKRGKEME